jgi:hypothetical protein
LRGAYPPLAREDGQAHLQGDLGGLADVETVARSHASCEHQPEAPPAGDVYEGGVPDERLELTAPQVRAAVDDYLRGTGAYGRYPGLSYRVRVDPATQRVEVSLSAPLDLPLTVPGSPEQATIGATGSAVVGVDPD